jgi:cytochrome c-type biogenesis protein CcmH
VSDFAGRRPVPPSPADLIRGYMGAAPLDARVKPAHEGRRGWRKPSGFAVALLLAALSLSPAWAVSDPAELLSNPAQETRAEAIGARLRCLVCQNESIEDSNADLARDLRTIIRQQVVAGRSDQAIIAYMVQRYGSFILLKPPFNGLTFVLWATPFLAIALGLIIAVGAAWRRRGRRAETPPALTETERARLETILHP